MCDITTVEIICAKRVLICSWWVLIHGSARGPVETLWVYCFEFVDPVCFPCIEFVLNC